MTLPDKPALFELSKPMLATFCRDNCLPVPPVKVSTRKEWSWNACAFYRPVYINICVDKCAAIGVAGMQWSYPGYVVDRTPYGVVAHELGHHVDREWSERKGPYMGDFSNALRGRTDEKPITTYCPNDAEWFAEIMRLFITNPDLLRLIRPRTYRELVARFNPVYSDSWQSRLADAPARIVQAATNKIEGARE